MTPTPPTRDVVNPPVPEHRGWRAIADGQHQRENEATERSETRSRARSRESDSIVESLHRYVRLLVAAEQPATKVFVDQPARSLLWLCGWPQKVSAYVVAKPYNGGSGGPTRPGIAVTASGDVIILRRPTKHAAPEGQYAVGDEVSAAVAHVTGSATGRNSAEKLDEMLVHLLRDRGVSF